MNNNWKRNIVLFITSQTISLLGSSLVQYAVMWYITINTQSGTMMTISILCSFLPTFFLSPFAGVWADRYNRKIIIMVSDSVIAIATLVMAILFMIGYENVWLFFSVLVISAVGDAVQMPTEGAFIPQLVPHEKLIRINSINGSVQSVVMFISPLLGGILLTAASIKLLLFINVITAVIAVVVLFAFLHVPLRIKAVVNQSFSYFEELRAGFVYAINHKYVKTFFIFASVFFILSAPVSFLPPLQIARSLGNNIWRLTAIDIVLSAGMTMGGILMSIWGGFNNRAYTIAVSILITGVCTTALGIVSVFWIYLVVIGIVGIATTVFNIPAAVLLQENVKEEYMGRVFGVFAMITNCMMPIGMLLFGPLADYVRIDWLLRISGLLIIVVGIVLYVNKVLTEAGKRRTEKKL